MFVLMFLFWCFENADRTTKSKKPSTCNWSGISSSWELVCSCNHMHPDQHPLMVAAALTRSADHCYIQLYSAPHMSAVGSAWMKFAMQHSMLPAMRPLAAQGTVPQLIDLRNYTAPPESCRQSRVCKGSYRHQQNFSALAELRSLSCGAAMGTEAVASTAAPVRLEVGGLCASWFFAGGAGLAMGNQERHSLFCLICRLQMRSTARIRRSWKRR